MHSGFITGERLFLRRLVPEDATAEYLSWLNDPEVLRFRGPKAYPSSLADLRGFLERVGASADLPLAVCLRETGAHIGGVSLGSVNWVHRTAELSLMIGSRAAWGKGYGTEAVALIAAHAFDNMNLHKLWAESPNPAFNAIMRKLGWVREGTKREMFLLEGRNVDCECFGLLHREFLTLPWRDAARRGPEGDER